MESVSLMVELASGRRKLPRVPRFKDLLALGHQADRGVHMQHHLAVGVDLRRHVQHDAGEKGRELQRGRRCCWWCRRLLLVVLLLLVMPVT